MCPPNDYRIREGETLDEVFQGRLKIIQPRKGYRFSIDAVLLTGLTQIRSQDRVVDLGTGCGVIPLLIAFRSPADHITGIEIQESFVSMARRNVVINNFSHLISIVQADLRNLQVGMVEGPVNLVVSNPPYGRLSSGRLNPNEEKAIARHELFASLADVVRAAAQLLPRKGRLAIIYPARRLPNLLREISIGGFAPKHLTLIHTTLEAEAKLVHLESIKGGGEALRVHKPFAICQSDGSYTDEMNAMYENGPAAF
ncbi:MAG: methyltransferase [Syntrophobacterales bacterium]|jgi:tRNA1Val (adenine37-N6)-methyltransferase